MDEDSTTAAVVMRPGPLSPWFVHGVDSLEGGSPREGLALLPAQGPPSRAAAAANSKAAGGKWSSAVCRLS